MLLTQPIFYFLMNLVTLVIFYVASHMIDAGTLQVGKLIAFQEYLFHAMFSMMLFCNVFVMYPRAAVSAKRIMSVLSTQSDIKDHVLQTPQSSTSQHHLSFRNVTFAYPDGEEAVLKNISFEAHEGETIAFIGSTGSGKSTLINLIPRFYDVSKGTIYIDGIDIRDYDVKELRSKLGVIPQKAFLFSGSIKENICFGKEDASDEEIIHAARVAQAYDFIMEKSMV